MRPGIKPSGQSAADVPGEAAFAYQNRTKTLSETVIEVVRRAKSRFPKLLESLRKRTTEWNFWKEISRAQGRSPMHTVGTQNWGSHWNFWCLAVQFTDRANQFQLWYLRRDSGTSIRRRSA